MRLKWTNSEGQSHITLVGSVHDAAALVARDLELRTELNFPTIEYRLEEYNQKTRVWEPWQGPDGETDPVQYAEEHPNNYNLAMGPNEFRIHVVTCDDPNRTNIYRVWTDNPDPLIPEQRSADDVIAAHILHSDIDLREALGLAGQGPVQALAIGTMILNPNHPGEVDLQFRLVYVEPLNEEQQEFVIAQLDASEE